MNIYRQALTISLGLFVFPWERDVGVGLVFGMAAFFQKFASIRVVLLAWNEQALRRRSPEWLLDTKAGKRMGFTEGESCGPEVMERKAVESPD